VPAPDGKFFSVGRETETQNFLGSCLAAATTELRESAGEQFDARIRIENRGRGTQGLGIEQYDFSLVSVGRRIHNGVKGR